MGGNDVGGKFVAFNSYVLEAGGGKRSAEVKLFDVDSKPFLAFGYSGLEKKFDHIQAGSACGNIVRYVEKIAACSAAHTKFNGSVVVDFLFDHRIIIDNVAKAVAGDCRIGNGDDCSGQDEAGDLFGFGSDPMEAIRSGFGCGVGEGFAVPIEIERDNCFGFVVFVGGVERVCVGVGRCSGGVRVVRWGLGSVK